MKIHIHYRRLLIIFAYTGQGFTIPFRLFTTDVLCHSLYQRQKRGTGDTKNAFKTANLDLLDYSYKIIMVVCKIT